MKKSIKLLLVLLIAVSLVTITGCNKENDPTASFKNPKTITYKTSKGKMTLTYDDDKKYEVVNNDPYVTLKYKDDNLRIDMDYSSNNLKQQEQSKQGFKKDKKYKVIEDLDYNGYKGYAMIQKTYGTTNIYLTLDKEKEIISNIKISAIYSSEAIKEIEKGTKPEDVFFNNEKVQQILKTLKYE